MLAETSYSSTMLCKIVTILAKLEGALGPKAPITNAKSMAFSVNQNDKEKVNNLREFRKL